MYFGNWEHNLLIDTFCTKHIVYLVIMQRNNSYLNTAKAIIAGVNYRSFQVLLGCVIHVWGECVPLGITVNCDKGMS